MDPEKWNKYMGLENMSAFGEFLIKKMCNAICSLKFWVVTSISKLNF